MRHLRTASPILHGSPAWALLPADSVVKQWAKELALAAAEPANRDLWGLVGQAVVVEDADLDAVDGVLRCVANDAGLDFRRVEAEDVMEACSDWVEAVADGQSILVYLAAGQWISGNLEGDDDDLGFTRSPGHDEQSAHAFRKGLRQFLEQEIPKRPMVVVTAIKSFRHLDPALRRTGCFDRRIVLPRITNEILAQTFIMEMGASALDGTLTDHLTRLGALLDCQYRDQRRRHLMEQALRRLCWREHRKATFNDVLTFATYGTGDEDTQTHESLEKRRGHAIHEAGHALVSYLESQDKIPPAYCCINGRNSLFGVVVTPHDAQESSSNDMTYANARYHIRVALAGRVAEHLVLGADQVSLQGATGDLQKASELASQMFGRWGLAPDADTDEAASGNLAVICGSPTPTEYDHVEQLVRTFLQKQFLEVLALLREQRVLLDRITDALTDKGILFQKDFTDILECD